MTPETTYQAIVTDYYEDDTITREQVAKKHNVSIQVVKYAITKANKGVKVRAKKPHPEKYAEVVDYFMENMNEPLHSIGVRFGVSTFTVSNWVSKHLQFITSCASQEASG